MGPGVTGSWVGVELKQYVADREWVAGVAQEGKTGPVFSLLSLGDGPLGMYTEVGKGFPIRNELSLLSGKAATTVTPSS